MDYLRIRKECFRIRCELQNDTITGVNSDEITSMNNNINREIRKIANLRPPFLKSTFYLQLQKSVALQTAGTTNTATGTRGLPELVDTSSNLGVKHTYWILSDGTYRRRMINNSGITYSLDYQLQTTVTTATAYTAFKDSYALPHNVGDIIKVYLQDGERSIEPASGTEFRQFRHGLEDSSEPIRYSLESFTNRWDLYKFNTTGTFTESANTINVTNTTYFDVGDIVYTTSNYLFTVTAVDSTNKRLYLDRKYTGSTAASRTIYCNPIQYTKYISFYYLPNTAKDVIIEGYLKPQDLVADTDECIFNDDLCWAIIIGAVNQDKISRRFLTKEDLIWYDSVMQDLKHDPYAGIELSAPPRRAMGGSPTFRQNRISQA